MLYSIQTNWNDVVVVCLPTVDTEGSFKTIKYPKSRTSKIQNIEDEQPSFVDDYKVPSNIVDNKAVPFVAKKDESLEFRSSQFEKNVKTVHVPSQLDNLQNGQKINDSLRNDIKPFEKDSNLNLKVKKRVRILEIPVEEPEMCVYVDPTKSSDKHEHVVSMPCLKEVLVKGGNSPMLSTL